MDTTPVPSGRSLGGSLTYKISLLSVTAMLVVLLVFAAVFIVIQRGEEKRHILERGRQFVSFSSNAIYEDYVQFYAPPLSKDSKDFEQFKERIRTKLGTNTSIVGVSLLATDGRILFDSGELQDGKYSGPVRTV